MVFYSFEVTPNLTLSTCDEAAEQVIGVPASLLAGKPYYEVFPRVWHQDRDAVAEVARSGNPLLLRDYSVICIFGKTVADIRLEPVLNQENVMGAVRVSVCASETCSRALELKGASTLIDIGKVSATLAHGVRNPLNAIKGAVVYLKHRYGSDETFVEFADIIDEEIAKLDGFITKFLSTSLLEMEKSRSDLHLLLEKVLKITSLQAQERNVRFVCDYGDVPFLEFDAFHLESAILNIVNNAIEAMGNGGTITFRTRLDTMTDRGQVTLDISDSGPGIPEGAFRTLLSPPRGNARDKGRGFGLFISREIIQHHGGHLEIINSKGNGATVRLCLPVESSHGETHAG
ncbi:histidine kinase [Geobacter hydrogenophilus]|nr:ATP-binding protein [Geobacter hydrogenophilus]MBT0895753.1 histidine kinase [Geobacter hydrogenophilus]